MHLAAAGIGRIGIMDMDTVDESNIQRQLLHGTDDVGLKKVNSTKRTLNKINPNVKIELLMKRLTKTPKQQQKNMTSSLMGQTISLTLSGNDTAVLLGILPLADRSFDSKAK